MRRFEISARPATGSERPTGRLCGLADPAWWRRERDESRRAVAEVEHDHLDDLSEIGRQVRREERRRRAIPLSRG